MNYQKISSRLSPGQISTIRGLDATPCILGCAEPTAIRLSKPAKVRPALTVKTMGPNGPMFALNSHGLEVKKVVEAARG
ncbi:hypothetical protein [Sphingomonas parapaucimobilis]|uniref:Uncharacterized protein n=1 Tax=Sphingomonas parapaucimobilis NBRC 15100 TaxID=1219049 RepID=A0A0A1W6E8_9SPHN|nr:hypothetical protein [Sphingomonas parapaucimobilis]GAM00742.1 hypothetical protein SP5_035_01440 [Sphingomonas parapaucimobilis NBRC 15100]